MCAIYVANSLFIFYFAEFYLMLGLTSNIEEIKKLTKALKKLKKKIRQYRRTDSAALRPDPHHPEILKIQTQMSQIKEELSHLESARLRMRELNLEIAYLPHKS